MLRKGKRMFVSLVRVRNLERRAQIVAVGGTCVVLPASACNKMTNLSGWSLVRQESIERLHVTSE